jgi:CBS domain-containing protein
MDRTRLSRFIAQPIGELELDAPLTAAPGAPVRDVVGQMREAGRSCVLAMSGDQLAGIFTERDVLMRCMGEAFDWGQLLSAVLTPDIITMDPGASVGDAIATMQRHQLRTLPVIREGRILGLVRTSDLLRHLVEEFPEDILNLPPRPHQRMETQEGG